MAKWSTGSESGILRKPVLKENFDDLLVFGYACKIFREDEKAQYIDQGKHLIPWMGNGSLKIDRYDCRGALSELTPYEATGHDASHWLGLSESEKRMEVLCDEERYYALQNNEEELEMYQEEETKRLLQKGTEFQYNYDVPRNPEQTEDCTDVSEQDETFVPPLELNIPVDIEVPKTVKENARIEKTAMFISSQGPQMEILIKTKQADNPQFNFMNKDNPLYKYYKHLLTAIKSGQYKVQSDTPTTEEKSEDTNAAEEHEGHYLHPSLVPTLAQPLLFKQAQPPPPLPTVIYKPSADCAYSQLVSRIQGTQSESATPPPPLPTQEVSQSQMSYEQQQYYQQYYYAAQYYEYYKQMAQQFTGQNADQSPTDALQDAGFTPEQVYAFCQNQTEFQNILQSQAAYQQYVQQATNPYAQLVTNLSQGKETHTDPTLNDISKAAILYTKSEVEEKHINEPIIGPQLPTATQEPQPENNSKNETCMIKMPLLSLAQYGSDSDEESDDEDDVKIPPKHLQQIIDKMAIYVSKNGKDFETIVRGKGDARFQFLNDNHEFHRYYRMKMDEYLNCNIKENGITHKEKKVIAPVSFSIKKPKDETPKEIKSALPIEESDEEHEGNVTAAKTSSSVVPLPLVPPTEVAKSMSLPLKETPGIASIPPNHENGNSDISQEEIPKNMEADKQIDAEDLILEMIDITEDLEELRECKRVENSRKDKITLAARERLALQLERKKKAAAFLKLKTNTTDVKLENSNESTSTTISKNFKTISKLNENTNTDKSSKSIKDNITITKKSKADKDDASLLNKLMSNSVSHKSVKDTKETLKEKIIEEIISIEDSDLEEGEIKKHKKASKKKKTRKRKSSKSRRESKSRHHRHRSKEHKKSKKRRKRSKSTDSVSSESS